MTVATRNIDRKVIPQFRALSSAVREGEAAPATRWAAEFGVSTEVRERVLAELGTAWDSNRRRGFAGDLVAAALVLGADQSSLEAAQAIRGSGESGLLGTIASRLLGEPVDDEDVDTRALDRTREHLRALKRRLRADPRAALTWAEAARLYAALGQRAQASDAIGCALALAPDDRFVIRSAARLLLHMDQADDAYRLLASAPALRRDPWLMAAEIAVAPSAGRRSKLIGQGRRLVGSGQFHPMAISELASAVATEALVAGSGREARQFFTASLCEPTGNAVAQAGWAVGQGASVEIPTETLEGPDTFEARAKLHARERRIDEAIDSAWEWVRDQPFAAQPAIFGAHVTALNRRWDESAEFAAAGLVANPSDWLLHNNRAFALASDDRVEEASREQSQINPRTLSDENKLVHQATRGLIEFRRGNSVAGRRLYRATIEDAKDAGLRAVAAIMLAREEIHARSPFESQARRLAIELADLVAESDSHRFGDLPDWIAQLEAEAQETR